MTAARECTDACEGRRARGRGRRHTDGRHRPMGCGGAAASGAAACRVGSLQGSGHTQRHQHAGAGCRSWRVELLLLRRELQRRHRPRGAREPELLRAHVHARQGDGRGGRPHGSWEVAGAGRLLLHPWQGARGEWRDEGGFPRQPPRRLAAIAVGACSWARGEASAVPKDLV